MIESGSHSAGGDRVSFSLPANTAMRWEAPHPSLAWLIGDYFVFDSEGPEVLGARSPMLPSWPIIRFALAREPMSIDAPGICWSPLPEAGFYGSASRVLHHTSNGGVTIGVNLTPAGVARLLNLDVSKFRDRMVSLDELIGERSAEIVSLLRSSDQGPAVKAILDEFFLREMPAPTEDEELIVALHKLLLDDAIRSAADLARELGLARHTLRRLSLKRFGFAPSLLIARTRFLRSLIAIRTAGGGSYRDIDEAYTDSSHFLRDCDRFLGLTARRFLSLEFPFLDAIIRVRGQVLGTALPTLGPGLYLKDA